VGEPAPSTGGLLRRSSLTNLSSLCGISNFGHRTSGQKFGGTFLAALRQRVLSLTVSGDILRRRKIPWVADSITTARLAPRSGPPAATPIGGLRPGSLRVHAPCKEVGHGSRLGFPGRRLPRVPAAPGNVAQGLHVLRPLNKPQNRRPGEEGMDPLPFLALGDTGHWTSDFGPSRVNPEPIKGWRPGGGVVAYGAVISEGGQCGSEAKDNPGLFLGCGDACPPCGLPVLSHSRQIQRALFR